MLPRRMKAFGAKVALESFWDGLIPPGKSERYIATVAAHVDRAMQDVRACTDVHARLKQVIPKDGAEL